jgi:hypothetical protein
MSPDSFFEDENSLEALKKIKLALEEFSVRYEDEIHNQEPVDAAQLDCKAHETRNFYWNLLHVWNHIRRQQGGGVIARNDISLNSLRDVVKRNREFVEKLPPREFGDLTDFYGKKQFKCSKLTCFYFHEGFDNAAKRDKHVNKHDRPFNCDVLGCSISLFGFTSNTELEKHKRFFHPEMVDLTTTFKVAKEPVTAAKYPCRLCGKRFTRSFSHKNHEMSHRGEKPFACSECGKAFTRKNDCVRHEKIHNK